jgi:hypothetical protein
MEFALQELFTSALLEDAEVAEYVNRKTGEDIRPPSTTALHILAAGNVIGAWRANMVRHLLDKGADASILDNKGAPAVYKAIGSPTF